MAKNKLTKNELVAVMFELPKAILKAYKDGELKGVMDDLDNFELLAKYTTVLVSTFFDHFDLKAIADEYVALQYAKMKAKKEAESKQKEDADSSIENSKGGVDA